MGTEHLDLNGRQSGFAIKAMIDGLKGKFSQNPHLLKFPMSTKGNRLVEANPQDTYWSSGISLKDSNKLLDIKHWPGKNELGNALEIISEAFDV